MNEHADALGCALEQFVLSSPSADFRFLSGHATVHPQAQLYLDALPPNMPLPERDIPVPKFRAAIDAKTK